VKYIFVTIFSLFVGYYLHPAFNATPQPRDNVTPFKKFIEKEAKNYAELQDAEAKLKAADEMYGKMMMLFLAELGLMAQPSRPVTNMVCPPVEKAIKDEVIDIETQKTDVALKVVSPDEATTPKKNEAPKNDVERWVKFASTPYIDNFSRKVRRMMFGQFEGQMRHLPPNQQRIDTVQMQFNLQQVDKKIEGDTLVSMIDPTGKEYSRNAGNGGNKTIKKGDSENSYYVEASPTSYFLLNLSKFPRVSGQYFERGKLAGNVFLRKIGP
jgi:hypothetical protein